MKLLFFILLMGLILTNLGCATKPQVDPALYNIFNGEKAIRELKKRGYQTHKIDGGYRLTQTQIGEIERYKGNSQGEDVERIPYISGKYDVDLVRGHSYDLRADGSVWCFVDRHEKIWLFVLNRIVLDRN